MNRRKIKDIKKIRKTIIITNALRTFASALQIFELENIKVAIGDIEHDKFWAEVLDNKTNETIGRWVYW